ncbi:hypothetical protein AB5I41_25000 [Sphingomonas sp. MMS24-JH45]
MKGMEIECDSLDTVLYRLYGAIKKHGVTNSGSRGDTLELLGVALHIRKPPCASQPL